MNWYAPQLARSLELIDEAGLSPAAALIDVGGGASTLPADLLDQGFSDITLLDVSSAAVKEARASSAGRPTPWIVGDVTQVACPRPPSTSGTMRPRRQRSPLIGIESRA